MEYQSLYIEAIQHIINAVKTSDPQYWWPKVIGPSQEAGVYLYDLGNNEVGSGSNRSGSNHGHAFAGAILRMIKNKQPCTLFAFPEDETHNAMTDDVVVGFISETQDEYTITPACNGTVYPLIGNSKAPWIFTPPSAKWMLCATLDTRYRRAVSLYCQNARQQEINECTPKLYTIVRKKEVNE